MQADFAVELGADDETLEMPWAASDGGLRYYDLKRHPELLSELEEAARAPELGEFLSKINSPHSPLETAKCDVWSSTEMNPEEEIFDGTHKFGSYIDLFFSDEAKRFSFPDHEHLAKRLVQLLQRAPEIKAAGEFLIRRCYYHESEEAPGEEEIRDGFYITFYLFGYGKDEVRSRQQWVIGLKLIQSAIRQLSGK
ncbi:MAG: hypothetical protein WB711_15210 [Terriglobales bacterium]